MNSVMASFNTTMVQATNDRNISMAKMNQRKNNQVQVQSGVEHFNETATRTRW